MKVKINVTENDIKNGAPADPRNCPISRAIKRILKKRKYEFVLTSPSGIEISKNYKFTTSKVSKVPVKAIHFMHKFDAYKDTTPINFTLDFK